LTSLHFKDITHPDHIARDVSQVNDLAGRKTALYQTDKQYIRKDKGVVWASITVNVMRDRDDWFLHFFTTVENITVRKQAEEVLNQSLKKLRKSLMGTIQAMVSMVEIRDPYTAGHEKRVSMLARAIAHELGLPNDVVDNIRMAAAIHDIGKISVPAEILSKPGRLTDIEMKLIQMHSQTGYDILKDVDLPYPIARIVLQHHERLNGSGYPQGVKAGEILLEARIVSVADVVEAMASYRPYRPALGIDAALEEIEKNKGIFYDAVVVDACVRLFREKGFKLE
jgi:putative nucleotidyltransferase with HDIG domain